MSPNPSSFTVSFSLAEPTPYFLNPTATINGVPHILDKYEEDEDGDCWTYTLRMTIDGFPYEFCYDNDEAFMVLEMSVYPDNIVCETYEHNKDITISHPSPQMVSFLDPTPELPDDLFA